ncbi:hypothetical protein GGX14DRAFT_397923 [Mycena pura]|uniref:Uncharacterized protein n=1 Tax=Mycena pura TaxID=153505 RepID=A0AAD6YC28_9AGAR|nr:hypothetical protein GGX14DRAFT_397923 [Mycena pura]
MPRETDRQWITDVALDMIITLRFVETICDDSMDADLFDSDDEDPDGTQSSSDSDTDIINSNSLSTTLIQGLKDIYSHRYLADRRAIQKSTEFAALLTNTWKVDRPEIFRSYLRLTPGAFDQLVEGIENDPVFHNNSELAEQLPVEYQVAIILF